VLSVLPRIRFAQQGAFFHATCAFTVVCLVMGGSTGPGFLSDTVVQLLAVPLLLAGLWRYSSLAPAEQPRWALAFSLMIAAIPAVQLLPLPPFVWTSLPGREPLAGSLALLDGDLPWAPISVSPRATWLSLVSLLPPIAVFLATVLLSYRHRRWLSLVILAVGVASVFLGLTQIAQGPASPLRFFAYTNPTEAVGFFANRNHFAALLYIMTLFTAAWAADAAMTAASAPQKRKFETGVIVPVLAGFTLLVAFAACQAMARSRAGIGLAIVALFGAFALGFSDRRAISGVTPAKLVLGATALATVLIVQFGLYRILERFTVDPMADARIPFARNTIEAARAFLPFGSGMGTFVPVYAMYEKPADLLANTFANHAHNDILQIWLEAGLLGVALMGMCAVWLVRRSLQVWRFSTLGTRTVDLLLARAASIAIGLLIVHSLFDYPLRTAAIMVTMAFAFALLINPPEADQEHAIDAQGGRHRQQKTPRDEPATVVAAARWAPPSQEAAPERSQTPRGERWGGGLDWPEEWLKPSDEGPGRTNRPPHKPDKPSSD
jgi:O-antigen ligase